MKIFFGKIFFGAKLSDLFIELSETMAGAEDDDDEEEEDDGEQNFVRQKMSRSRYRDKKAYRRMLKRGEREEERSKRIDGVMP